jgi:cation diffusion facilitator family transporter
MNDQNKIEQSAKPALALLAARITVYIIAILAVLKIVIGISVSSIAIISEGIHTTVDLAASLIAFYTLRTAMKPPDKDHPYGHGKFENLMGLIQGGFIIVPSGYIIYRAVHHVFSHRDVIFGENLQGLDLGIGVMILTVMVNAILGIWLRRIWRQTGSEAIRANAYHQFADLYTSIGVVAALFLVRLTGNVVFDPVVAILVAVYAIYLGWKLMFASADTLLDREASPEVIKRITEIIARSQPDILEYHKLRTRRAGQMVFGDIHILFCRDATIEATHKMMDQLEEVIEREVGNVDITMHAEPCEDDCNDCPHPGARAQI